MMNEFLLIDSYFKNLGPKRQEVILGPGDDAACVKIPNGKELVISTDSLVAQVHFLSSWDAYDIASKAILVNISDIAAMAAEPCWLSVALTMPEDNPDWLAGFAKGLGDHLNEYNISLIGGDLTRGPLSITITIHGFVDSGKAIRRAGASVGDRVFVSGELGAAALAVSFLNDETIEARDKMVLMEKLQHPKPRVDLAALLKAYASAAIDISDGLSADLNHICKASQVGVCLHKTAIPCHPLVKKYKQDEAAEFALQGGDDYELCFTIPEKKEVPFLQSLEKQGMSCYRIGMIEAKQGFRLMDEQGVIRDYEAKGYSHF